MDYILDLDNLKKSQHYLIHRGRTLLNRKEIIMDLGNGIGEVEEGKVVADLLHFVDFMISQSEGFDVDSLMIGIKKSS